MNGDPEGFYKSKREAFWFGFAAGVVSGMFITCVIVAIFS